MSQMISNKMINKPKQPRSYRYRIFVDEDESYRSLHDEHEESSGKGPSAPNIRKVYREPIDAQPKLMVSL